jgi:hypothetical protein
MHPSAVLPEHLATQQAKPGVDPGTPLPCPLPASPLRIDALTSDLCNSLEDAGCPLAPAIQERLRFETLVTELSAKFVNVSASQVDSQIESGLQRIVEFLRIDQGGLAEVLMDQKQLVITHSYHTTGAAHVRVVMDEALPCRPMRFRNGNNATGWDSKPR